MLAKLIRNLLLIYLTSVIATNCQEYSGSIVVEPTTSTAGTIFNDTPSVEHTTRDENESLDSPGTRLQVTTTPVILTTAQSNWETRNATTEDTPPTITRSISTEKTDINEEKAANTEAHEDIRFPPFTHSHVGVSTVETPTAASKYEESDLDEYIYGDASLRDEENTEENTSDSYFTDKSAVDSVTSKDATTSPPTTSSPKETEQDSRVINQEDAKISELQSEESVTEENFTTEGLSREEDSITSLPNPSSDENKPVDSVTTEHLNYPESTIRYKETEESFTTKDLSRENSRTSSPNPSSDEDKVEDNATTEHLNESTARYKETEENFAIEELNREEDSTTSSPNPSSDANKLDEYLNYAESTARFEETTTFASVSDSIKDFAEDTTASSTSSLRTVTLTQSDDVESTATTTHFPYSLDVEESIITVPDVLLWQSNENAIEKSSEDFHRNGKALSSDIEPISYGFNGELTTAASKSSNVLDFSVVPTTKDIGLQEKSDLSPIIEVEYHPSTESPKTQLEDVGRNNISIENAAIPHMIIEEIITPLKEYTEDASPPEKYDSTTFLPSAESQTQSTIKTTVAPLTTTGADSSKNYGEDDSSTTNPDQQLLSSEGTPTEPPKENLTKDIFNVVTSSNEEQKYSSTEPSSIETNFEDNYEPTPSSKELAATEEDSSLETTTTIIDVWLAEQNLTRQEDNALMTIGYEGVESSERNLAVSGTEVHEDVTEYGTTLFDDRETTMIDEFSTPIKRDVTHQYDQGNSEKITTPSSENGETKMADLATPIEEDVTESSIIPSDENTTEETTITSQPLENETKIRDFLTSIKEEVTEFTVTTSDEYDHQKSDLEATTQALAIDDYAVQLTDMLVPIQEIVTTYTITTPAVYSDQETIEEATPPSRTLESDSYEAEMIDLLTPIGEDVTEYSITTSDEYDDQNSTEEAAIPSQHLATGDNEIKMTDFSTSMKEEVTEFIITNSEEYDNQRSTPEVATPSQTLDSETKTTDVLPPIKEDINPLAEYDRQEGGDEAKTVSHTLENEDVYIPTDAEDVQTTIEEASQPVDDSYEAKMAGLTTPIREDVTEYSIPLDEYVGVNIIEETTTPLQTYGTKTIEDSSTATDEIAGYSTIEQDLAEIATLSSPTSRKQKSLSHASSFDLNAETNVTEQSDEITTLRSIEENTTSAIFSKELVDNGQFTADAISILQENNYETTEGVFAEDSNIEGVDDVDTTTPMLDIRGYVQDLKGFREQSLSATENDVDAEEGRGLSTTTTIKAPNEFATSSRTGKRIADDIEKEEDDFQKDTTIAADSSVSAELQEIDGDFASKVSQATSPDHLHVENQETTSTSSKINVPLTSTANDERELYSIHIFKPDLDGSTTDRSRFGEKINLSTSKSILDILRGEEVNSVEHNLADRDTRVNLTSSDLQNWQKVILNDLQEVGDSERESGSTSPHLVTDSHYDEEYTSTEELNGSEAADLEEEDDPPYVVIVPSKDGHLSGNITFEFLVWKEILNVPRHRHVYTNYSHHCYTLAVTWKTEDMLHRNNTFFFTLKTHGSTYFLKSVEVHHIDDFSDFVMKKDDLTLLRTEIGDAMVGSASIELEEGYQLELMDVNLRIIEVSDDADTADALSSVNATLLIIVWSCIAVGIIVLAIVIVLFKKMTSKGTVYKMTVE